MILRLVFSLVLVLAALVRGGVGTEPKVTTEDRAVRVAHEGAKRAKSGWSAVRAGLKHAERSTHDVMCDDDDDDDDDDQVEVGCPASMSHDDDDVRTASADDAPVARPLSPLTVPWHANAGVIRPSRGFDSGTERPPRG